MGPGFFYYHRGPDGPQIRRALLLLAISGLLAFALYAGAQMRPLLGSLATTRVSNAVNRIVYQAVNEAIDSGQIAYEQLVSYEKDNEGRYIRQERATGSCARSFYVGKELEPKDISAKFENGILSLHLPKADAKKLEPKQTLIEIE